MLPSTPTPPLVPARLDPRELKPVRYVTDFTGLTACFAVAFATLAVLLLLAGAGIPPLGG